MFRLTCFLTSLAILLTSAGTALAQEPPPQHTAPLWDASYWNNTSLSGTPVLQRGESNLDYDWGSGSPAPGIVNADGFSARWTRYIDVTPGVYRFTATSDDGVRVWVDGKLIINAWNDHAPTTFTADQSLGTGHRLVTVEFYENGGGAVARLSWAPQAPAIQNWRGEYYNTTSPAGNPVLIRDDPQINFDWGAGSPAAGIVNAERFSARWTRSLTLPAGSYRFSMTVDDGGRLWVNGHLLIDAWYDQAARTYTGDIYLPGGAIPIEMDYYENGGSAVARLSWASSGTPPAGGVTVDDTDPGFVKGGSASGWRTVQEGYGGSLTWTRNNDAAHSNYNWARWYPELAAGTYEVLAFIPERYTTTSNAVYWISHADGYTRRVVDQSISGSQWVSLGSYRFRGTRDDYVSLNDITGERRLTRLIAFDAVRWVAR
ncbi:MAG: hypothetical protein JW850_00125 [Thermoflexales bacterium]|nr:hypothetical protein [Thermoflexales bacterium]